MRWKKLTPCLCHSRFANLVVHTQHLAYFKSKLFFSHCRRMNRFQSEIVNSSVAINSTLSDIKNNSIFHCSSQNCIQCNFQAIFVFFAKNFRFSISTDFKARGVGIWFLLVSIHWFLCAENKSLMRYFRIIGNKLGACLRSQLIFQH